MQGNRAKVQGHRGVRVILHEAPALLTKTVPVAVQRLPPDPVYGPHPPPLDWSEAMYAAEEAVRTARTARRAKDVRQSLRLAYGQWAKIAEQNLADVTGVDLDRRRLPRSAGLRLTQVPVFGSGRGCVARPN